MAQNLDRKHLVKDGASPAVNIKSTTWDLNSGLLEEQSVHLTAEPSLYHLGLRPVRFLRTASGAEW